MIHTILLIIALQVVVINLSGCTTLQDKMDEQQQQLKCSPANSINCTGWEV
jgi:uncharacterized protein YceK